MINELLPYDKNWIDRHQHQATVIHVYKYAHMYIYVQAAGLPMIKNAFQICIFVA